MNYRLQKEHLAGPMFTFQSCRKLMTRYNWTLIRSYFLNRNFPNKIYQCDICGATSPISTFVEMHEVYEAEYDVKKHKFSVQVSKLEFLCRKCHITKHKNYFDSLPKAQQSEIIEHIATVNQIPYEEAEKMPAISVPNIKIIGGKPTERFNYEYSERDVKKYEIKFGIKLEDTALQEKIDRALNNVKWIKKGEDVQIEGVWYHGPTAISLPINRKTQLPFTIDGEKLKSRRKIMGYGKRNLAELLGVSYDTYCSWEGKNRNPSLENFEKLKEILKCKESDLRKLN